MPIIFRKTAKGVAEIETRANRLAPRLRSLLILVDGKRDAQDLQTLVAKPADEWLQTLVDEGFIEPVGETVRAEPAAAPVAAPPPPPATPAVDLALMRRQVVRALGDELGPPADSLAMRVERSRTLDELRPLVAQAVQLVVAARGRAAADAFAARLPAL